MFPKSLLLAAVIPALCAAEDRQTTFAATTKLVEFTVVALDKKGAAVPELTEDQFTVSDNGNPRRIAFFRYEGIPDASTPARAPKPGTFANRIDMGAVPPRNGTALVLDGLNTNLGDQAVVKAQML